jgi:hypothetical protein
MTGTSREGYWRDRTFAGLIMTHDFDKATRIIERGYDVNKSYTVLGTPILHERAYTLDLVAVDFLVRHGADRNLRAPNGLTALDYASSRVPTPTHDLQTICQVMDKVRPPIPEDHPLTVLGVSGL